jgi:hypothetical protein
VTNLPPTVERHTAEVWAARPLSSWARKYSTDRVYLISAIYADFKAKGYITPALAEQSARYLALHRAYMPKLGSGHLFPILPHGIITAVPPGGLVSARRVVVPLLKGI